MIHFKRSIQAISGLVLILTLIGISPLVGQWIASPARMQGRMNAPMVHGNGHLGAEYYNIAASMVNGKGFSNPFYVHSGPTAWMPPLLVWIQAGLIWLFNGHRFGVILVVVLLKSSVLLGCGVALLRLDRGTRFRG